MNGPIRYIPPGGSLVEITGRTQQGRYLLPPTAHFARIFTGVLAEAQKRQPVRIHAAVCMSNHYHLLLSVDDVRQMAEFMRFFVGNLAREASRFTGWNSKIFPRRYTAILVSQEEVAQVERLRYLLAHGVKENLVSSPTQWPGLHCAQALMDGTPLRGIWLDRTLRYEAKRQNRELDRKTYESEQTVELEPLPSWGQLAPRTVRRRIRHLVEQIETEAALRFHKTGKPPLGIEAIRRQEPTRRPDSLKKSPASLVHAASQAVRQTFLRAYRLFIAAYRHAAALLKAGNRQARFPEGCFPPSLPYVPHATEPMNFVWPRAPG